MAIVSEELKDSIKTKILGSQSVPRISSPVSSESTETSNVSLKILGKNMMSLPGIARDMNVARQNVQKLVKIMGGEAATGADAHMLKESERAKKLDVESAKEKEKIQKVERVESKEDSKKPSFFEKMKNKIKESETFKKLKELKDKFSQNKFVKAFAKYFKLIVIFSLLFVIFKDAIVEWAKGLYETIKEKFDEFVGKIKEWFNEIVQPIIDKVKAFIMPIVEKIGEFFKSIGDWFVDKFGFIGEWFTNTFSFVGKIVDKFKAMIEAVKENLRELYEKAPSAIKKLVPDFVVKFIGAKTEKEKEEEKKKEELQKRALSNVVDDSREAKKLQQQQGEAQRAEAERADIPRRQEERQKKVEERDRVAALEKEKQYTGTDEIVRARLGLPSVAASQMDVGPEVTQPRTPLAPTAVVAEVPQKAPSPISAEPPTATGKQAEGPAGGGSLASVASVQPGVDLSGINPEFEKRLINMATAFKEETGKKLLITSAYRSNEKQAELFNAKLKEVGGDRAAARRMVAEPMPPLGQGRGSFHLKGLAIDINSKGPNGINALAGSRDSPTGWLEKFGLTRPVKNEDWHIQPSGTVPTADNPVSPGAPTLVAGKDGKPMNVTDGKKETMPQASAMQTVASGGEVSAASNQVAVSHREQIKPQTPVVVNAPVTNNNVTQTNQTLTKCKPCGSSDALVNRVA
jgi:hypothetical protein